MRDTIIIGKILNNQLDRVDPPPSSFINKLYTGVELPQQISLYEFLDTIIHSERKSMLYNVLESIDETIIYKSMIHGQAHVERVTLITFYIITALGLPDDLCLFCLYAAVYHDIGRMDDSEDPEHGRRGAEKLESVLHNVQFSLTRKNKALICAVVEAHSLPDTHTENVLCRYKSKYGDIDRMTYYTILNIIKDSDALDRFRLSDHSLNINFLRLDISRRLIYVGYCLNHFK